MGDDKDAAPPAKITRSVLRRAVTSPAMTSPSLTTSLNKIPFKLLELKVIVAHDLPPVSRYLHTYVMAWVHPDNKMITPVDHKGNTNPKWNFRMVFGVDDKFLNSESSAIMMEIYNISKLSNRPIGTTCLPVDILLNNPHSEIMKKPLKLPIARPSGDLRGHLIVTINLVNTRIRNLNEEAEHSPRTIMIRQLSQRLSHAESAKRVTYDEDEEEEQESDDVTTLSDHECESIDIEIKPLALDVSTLKGGGIYSPNSKDSDMHSPNCKGGGIHSPNSKGDSSNSKNGGVYSPNSKGDSPNSKDGSIYSPNSKGDSSNSKNSPNFKGDSPNSKNGDIYSPNSKDNLSNSQNGGISSPNSKGGSPNFKDGGIYSPNSKDDLLKSKNGAVYSPNSKSDSPNSKGDSPNFKEDGIHSPDFKDGGTNSPNSKVGGISSPGPKDGAISSPNSKGDLSNLPISNGDLPNSNDDEIHSPDSNGGVIYSSYSKDSGIHLPNSKDDDIHLYSPDSKGGDISSPDSKDSAMYSLNSKDGAPNFKEGEIYSLNSYRENATSETSELDNRSEAGDENNNEKANNGIPPRADKNLIKGHEPKSSKARSRHRRHSDGGGLLSFFTTAIMCGSSNISNKHMNRKLKKKSRSTARSQSNAMEVPIDHKKLPHDI